MEIRGIKIHNNQLEEIEGITPEYPYVMHTADMRRTHIPWHWHEEVEFSYMQKGSLKVSTINGTYHFSEGEGYFVNSNILAAMEAEGDSDEVIHCSHLFHPIFLSGHFKSIFETKYVTPVIQDKRFDLVEFRNGTPAQKRILSLLKKASLIQHQQNCEFQTRNIFSEIWLLLIDEIRSLEAEKMPAKPADQDRIQTMLAFIQENYSERISLADIAASVSISPRECTRCFKEMIHQTPFDYLMEYRIQCAEKLLSDTNDSVLDIAMQCGFSNSAYFGKIFRQRHGKTPLEYRKSRTIK